MPQDDTVIRFEDVSLLYGDTHALDHVSFFMKPGETCVVLGAAGSGKTMLLKCTVGLVKPDSGRVILFGRDVTNWTENQMFDIRAKVGILFQEGGLFDSLTIAENVAYPLENQHALSNDGKLSENAILERVRESLRFVELEHTLEKFPSELSGGMRRRVGIARATVTEPPLVLYDSPTAGLDPITANTIINLIIKERDLRDTAAIMVTHRFLDGHLMANFRYNPNNGNVEPVVHGRAEDSAVTTRFLVMKEGRLVFEGSERELLENPDPYVQKFCRAGTS
ncbi:MAG TPA: ATP-binding cassette domain-containing protein [Bryobacteraceae bacterium]|nr:ATP-binding cassette domain-containing protein [Bryobacteraceae bacterium]